MPSRTKEVYGWGLRISRPEPHLAYDFSFYKELIENKCPGRLYRPVKVVLLPLAEFRRLKRLANK